MSKDELRQSLEALLFVSAKPLSEKKLAGIIGGTITDIRNLLEELHENYKERESGIRLIKSGTRWQMATSETVSKIVSLYIKEEVSGELSKPSLEALAIIAYRGPITKAEIEEIRGVNCSVIIRNLLIRGLIDETKQSQKIVPSFQITVEFLKYIGIERVSNLPDFEALHSHSILEQFSDKKV